MCKKRCFESEQHAKRAHRRCGWRLRVYYCAECRALHVTNNEKRERRYDRGDE